VGPGRIPPGAHLPHLPGKSLFSRGTHRPRIPHDRCWFRPPRSARRRTTARITGGSRSPRRHQRSGQPTEPTDRAAAPITWPLRWRANRWRAKDFATGDRGDTADTTPLRAAAHPFERFCHPADGCLLRTPEPVRTMPGRLKGHRARTGPPGKQDDRVNDRLATISEHRRHTARGASPEGELVWPR
jgi:hypothetical protein